MVNVTKSIRGLETSFYIIHFLYLTFLNPKAYLFLALNEIHLFSEVSDF